MFVEDELARVVRATVSHLIAHAREQRGLDRTLASAVFPNSTNPTHRFLPRITRILFASIASLVVLRSASTSKQRRSYDHSLVKPADSPAQALRRDSTTKPQVLPP